MLSILTLFIACAPGDVRRVRQVIEQGRRGVVRQDLQQVMSVVAQDYRDGFGLDYTRLRQWFATQFRNYDSIVCIIPRLKTHITQTSAVCTMTVWFAGYRLGRKVAPEETGIVEGFPLYADDLVVLLRRTETGWLVYSAGP